MSKPLIAIVGRPNVGKSALFNRIVKKRLSIVDELEGVTRDRLYAESECFGKPFEIVDTGGIDERGDIPFWEEVKCQAQLAVDEAEILIMVVDGQIGLTALDEDIARYLLRKNKRIVLAVNKIDGIHQENLIHEFHALGIEKMITVSAVQGRNIAELLEEALEGVEKAEPEEPKKGIKVAIIGRPNVGKSTFINTLLNEPRCVVSDTPGTTRDSIDIDVTFEGEDFHFIDTAGLRRRKSEPEVVDKFSRIRTERAIGRADLCLFIADAREGLTTEEKRILSHIEKEGKGCLLYLNKWDLVKDCRMEHTTKAIRDQEAFLKHCPIICGSALTGRNVDRVFAKIKKIYEALTTRISTGQLNKFLERAMQLNHPPMIKGKRLRVFYMTQVSTLPPKFVLFVNYPDLMSESYKKYLINQFRLLYPFPGVPLPFFLKKRSQKERKSSAPELTGPSSVAEIVATF